MLESHAKAARELFLTIQDELDHREEDLREGLSFLDMKNDTLLSYMIDVCNIILRKLRGESIENHESVERCVEYRVILEKIKAIDQKLAYQLNKLITLPDDAVEEDQRINIDNLDIDIKDIDSDEAEEDSEGADTNSGDDELSEDAGDDDGSDKISSFDASSDEEEESHKPQTSLRNKVPAKTSTGIYKPPKLRSVAYTEDYKKGDKGRRKDYSEFYQDEDPRNIMDNSEALGRDERTRFEEDNYTRLPDDNPKKTKRKLRTKEYRKKGPNKHKRRR